MPFRDIAHLLDSLEINTSISRHHHHDQSDAFFALKRAKASIEVSLFVDIRHVIVIAHDPLNLVAPALGGDEGRDYDNRIHLFPCPSTADFQLFA